MTAMATTNGLMMGCRAERAAAKDASSTETSARVLDILICEMAESDSR